MKHGLDNAYRTKEQIQGRIKELIQQRNGCQARLNELKPTAMTYDKVKSKITRLTGRIDNLIFWFNY